MKIVEMRLKLLEDSIILCFTEESWISSMLLNLLIHLYKEEDFSKKEKEMKEDVIFANKEDILLNIVVIIFFK